MTKSERDDPSSRIMKYAGGGQLNKVEADDILWIINVKSGILYLIGRLHVAYVVEGMIAAQRALGIDDDLWQGQWYAIPREGTTEPMAYINAMHIASDLRFESESDRLTIENGRIVSARQLQAMRQVSPASVICLSEVWYGSRIIEGMDNDLQETYDLIQDHQVYSEGETRFVTRLERHRNRKLILDAKEQYKRDNDGLFCEVCDFDFTKTYGVEYIEAHHIKPLSQQDGVEKRDTTDLAMLCANCHRVIHSQTPPMTISELKSRINSRREDD